MTGTVLLTGANGSLAIPAVGYLLSAYQSLTFVLTVRNDSDGYHNTAQLRRIIAKYPTSSVFIRKLDLSSLKEVKDFSDGIASEIEQGKLPRLVAIICNAMAWRLSGGPAYSQDEYESSIAINHLAHFTLSLKLLGVMDPQHGRIVFLGSVAHWPEKASFSKGFPTKLPDNLDLLVHPEADKNGEEFGRGFQRYAVSKLVITVVAYELNRRLKRNKDLENIHAITVDPLDLLDSKTFFQDHVPRSMRVVFTIAGWLLPLLKLFQPRLISVEQAAKPVVDVAVSDEFAGQEGYFEGATKVESSPDSQNEEMQKDLWERSVVWCGLKSEAIVLEV